MIVGFVLVLLWWCVWFGLNVPVRLLVMRSQTKRQEVVARFDVRQVPPSASVRRRKRLSLAYAALLLILLLLIEGANQETVPSAVGVLIGALVVQFVLWPLYQRSKTYRMETVVLDRQGVTIFPARPSQVVDSTFHTRIEWKDCFGYSVLRGHFLLALLPFGHVEQDYGEQREAMQAVLDRLGVRKLTLFDVLKPQEVDEVQLLQAEQRVQALVHDLFLGFRHELNQYGLRLDFEQKYSDPDAETEERFAFLKLRLWEADECVQQVDWLIWARYDEMVELLTLPEERLYEMLDDKVQAMVEACLKERGVTQKPPILQ